MMGLTYIALVDLLDNEGYALGRTIPVIVSYATEVDQSYGEDADGHRGVAFVSHEILDYEIAPEDVAPLNSDQVERLLEEARGQFERRYS